MGQQADGGRGPPAAGGRRGRRGTTAMARMARPFTAPSGVDGHQRAAFHGDGAGGGGEFIADPAGRAGGEGLPEQGLAQPGGRHPGGRAADGEQRDEVARSAVEVEAVVHRGHLGILHPPAESRGASGGRRPGGSWPRGGRGGPSRPRRGSARATGRGAAPRPAPVPGRWRPCRPGGAPGVSRRPRRRPPRPGRPSRSRRRPGRRGRRAAWPGRGPSRRQPPAPPGGGGGAPLRARDRPRRIPLQGRCSPSSLRWHYPDQVPRVGGAAAAAVSHPLSPTRPSSPECRAEGNTRLSTKGVRQ